MDFIDSCASPGRIKETKHDRQKTHYFSWKSPRGWISDHSTYKAENLGLTGWVRNCYDGSVEMEVQGDPNKINDLILYLQAQRFIQIEEMDEKKIPLQEEETAFRERW